MRPGAPAGLRVSLESEMKDKTGSRTEWWLLGVFVLLAALAVIRFFGR